MFDEARRRKERGQDVVVGALQPEVPPEIKSLLDVLEVVPTIDVEGVPVIDVPAILCRHPQVCIIDGWRMTAPGAAMLIVGKMSMSCFRRVSQWSHLWTCRTLTISGRQLRSSQERKSRKTFLGNSSTRPRNCNRR